MRPSLRLLPLLALLVTGLVAVGGGTPAAAAADRSVYAVDTANNLVRFDRTTPGTIDATQAITGLEGGETVVGMDFRPADQALYLLGSTSRLYTVDTGTGVATAVGSASAFTLAGTSFGVDFNPVPDRLRVVSDTNQNLRLNPNDGALAATDGTLNPGDPDIVGAAYTNSYPGATTTTLYTIDAATDQLNIQTPPNNGVQVTVGSLGVDTSALVGFDITPANQAFAALTVGAASSLYTTNLETGAATLVGPIGGANDIVALALPLSFMAVPNTYATQPGQPIAVAAPGVRGNDVGGTAAMLVTGPSNGVLNLAADGGFSYTPAAGFTGIDSFVYRLADPPDFSNSVTVRLAVKGGDAFAVDTTNNLLRFDRFTPATIDASVPITGLAIGETITGMDFRPADGRLYAVGSTSRLYQVDASTGVGDGGRFGRRLHLVGNVVRHRLQPRA